MATRTLALRAVELARAPAQALDAIIARSQRHPTRGLRLVAAGAVLIREILDADLPGRAAASAYTLVLALIPLLTTSLAFFTAFPGLQGQRAWLRDRLLDFLLPGAVKSVEGYLARFSERAAAAGAVSSLAFLVLALLVLKNVERTFSRVWHVDAARTWAERVRVLALVFLGGAVAVTAMVAVSDLGVADRLAAFPTLVGLLASWVLFFVVITLFPPTRVRPGPALAAAVTMGSVWHLSRWGFTWYVTSSAHYETLYGPIGVAFAFIFWVYLTVLMLLVAGSISFVAQNYAALRAERRPTLYPAVAAAALLARAFLDGDPERRVRDLAGALGVSAHAVAHALVVLKDDGVLLRTGGTFEEAAYAMGAPPESITVARIVRLTGADEFCVEQNAAPSALRDEVAALFVEAKSGAARPLAAVTLANLARAIA